MGVKELRSLYSQKAYVQSDDQTSLNMPVLSELLIDEVPS